MSYLFDPKLDDFLKALSSQTRRGILLVFMDGKERTVNQIALESSLGQSTASEHLSQLKRAQVLISRRDGKQTFYFPNIDGITKTLKNLTEAIHSCCSNELSDNIKTNAKQSLELKEKESGESNAK